MCVCVRTPQVRKGACGAIGSFAKVTHTHTNTHTHTHTRPPLHMSCSNSMLELIVETLCYSLLYLYLFPGNLACHSIPTSLCAENTCLHDTHTDTHTGTQTHTNSRVCSPSHTHMRARAHARTRTHSCTHTGSGTRVLRERAATTFDRANTRRPRFGAHCCC